MSEIAIGIDLGTSNSCVAVRRGDAVDVLANAYGESTTASVVFFESDGSIRVGNAAKANIIHDPVRTISSAKRLIGRYYFSQEVKKAKAICAYKIVEGENHGVVIQVGEETFSLPEISAMVLREMKSVAETRLGQPVTKAVITVPAYFNDNQRQATKDAGRIAGLEVLRIMNEPTAAALAYGFGRGLTQRVAVWDLGGGTFDISVLEIGDDVFEVLATCGDTFLGGDDFDDRLIDLLAEEFLQKEGINLRNDPFSLEKLKVAAEGAKKALSIDDEVEIRIPDIVTNDAGEGLSIQRNLSVTEYASLVNDLIMRTFKVCDEALQHAGVVARDLDGVILVGGPTRLPLIRHAVGEYFQQEPKTDVDPDEVVAMGAAIHAASLVNPDREAYLLDVTPLSLRIGVAGGLAETVIERNTPVPIEQTRTFTTFKDFQESVDIRVYQGESREAEDNEMLGQFVFSGFEKARRGEVEIDVTFEINADGIVDVRARDRATGEEASTRITLSAGLSEGEIEQIIEDGRTDRVETAGLDDAAVVALDRAEPVPDARVSTPREPDGPLFDSDDEAPDLEVLEGDDEEELEIGEPVLPLDHDDLDALEGPPLEAGPLDDPHETPVPGIETDSPITEPAPAAVAEPVDVAEPVLVAEPIVEPVAEPLEATTDPLEAIVASDATPADEHVVDVVALSEELVPEPEEAVELEDIDDVELIRMSIEEPPPATGVDTAEDVTDPNLDLTDPNDFDEDLFAAPGTDLSTEDEDGA